MMCWEQKSIKHYFSDTLFKLNILYIGVCVWEKRFSFSQISSFEVCTRSRYNLHKTILPSLIVVAHSEPLPDT